jgi:two-component system sensor histidine kinase UhpB
MGQADRRAGKAAKVVNGRRALGASLVYAALASAWVVASDWVLLWMADDAATQSALQTYKGWAFVAVTATLLYFLLPRWAPPLAAETPGTSPGARRLRVLVGTVTAFLIVAIAAGLGLNLWSERKALLASAAQDSRDLVHIIEEQTAASINAADLALRVLERAVDGQAASPGGSRALEAQMRQYLALLPFLSSIVHLDTSGRVLHQSNLQPATRAEIASRDFFRALRDRATEDLYVGEPFVSERAGTPIFTLSRRLETPAGEFAGVLTAAVDIGYFERLYGGLHTRYARAIVLARRDGVVLARQPQVHGLAGRSFAASRLFSDFLPKASSGTFRGVSEVDGMARIFSYRAVSGRPLVAVLGLDEEDILAPWRRQALAYAGIALAGTLTLLWLAFLTLRGLSRRERLLEELRENEARFRALWQTSTDAVLIVDSDNRIRYANPAVAPIFGHEPAALRGQSLALLQPARFAARHAAGMKRYLETGRKTLNWGAVETKAVRRDGSEFPVEVAFSEHEIKGERLFAGFIRDITERKLNEANMATSRARLQALSDQLLQVQEVERANLARELHDEFGQTLTAVKLQLQTLGQQTPSPFLEDCIALVDQGLKQVRALSLDLRPPQLERLGLATALRAHVGRLSQQTGAPVTFGDAPGFPGLTGPRAVACFRIVQEALTNAIRHARAQSVRVRLDLEPGVLLLEVADDGAGFDLEAKRSHAAQGGSLGLLSMEERAHLLGGALEIHTRVGGGTRVTARVPLWPPEEAAS